jgi:cellulose synthase/poly-beta-1,6-N-acetylglucosamine synthase-like glycosyltransferase/peptidoglycan/xylan/chitin deacetylase (PgdA/CDA1 family)
VTTPVPEGEPRPRRRLPNPPTHWVLLSFSFVVVLAVILLAGVATHAIGASRETDQLSNEQFVLSGKRPLLTASGGRLASNQPPPGRRISLTFDDGPDPKWTPRIAALLRRERIPATFFVVGSQAARHPDVVRMLVRDGHEIGNHSFTHAQLTRGSRWQRRLQLDLTEAVIVGITGHYTRFLRPPYSATPDAVTRADERELARLVGRRYVLALADFDSEDWRREGVKRIVENASPRGSTGGIIMFHDGGGDRAQTMAALRKLVPQLKARGFRFVSLAELSGLPEHVLYPRASPAEHLRGIFFFWAVRSALFVTTLFSVLLLIVAVLVAARAAVALTLAVHHRRAARRSSGDDSYTPPVTVVVPAYNEAVVIERTVRSLAASNYPSFEVVVVDDGSTDGTAQIVESLGLERVRVVEQQNAGKPAALNTGLRVSHSEIVVMVDADTIFEPETLRRLVRPLADPAVGAVSGNTKVGNKRTLLGYWQHIEYVMGFNLDRRMYDVLQCIPTIPGAVGAFRREALEEIGGISGDTLAEDTDVTLAIGRSGRRVVYVEDARAWTEAPATLGGLWRQRYRWSFGTMQAVWKHKGAIFSRDPRQRRIGRRALPYMTVFQIILPMTAPVIDLFVLYGLVFMDPKPALVFWLGFNLLQLAVAIVAFRLDRESLRPLWALPLQQFVYRQLMYLVIIESTISALGGARARWLSVQRTGDVKVETAPGG